MEYSVERFAASKRLPSLPEVALRLIEIAQQDEPDFGEAARVISADPASCAKILKTVNSPLFGLRSAVSSVDEAIPKLGITMLRTLILSFHLAHHKTQQLELRSTVRRFWRSSLTQAVIAELLAERIDGSDPPTFFLTGLIQDIGLLAMLVEVPDKYLDEILVDSQYPNLVIAELDHFEFCHVDVTAEIAKGWGLDSGLIEAMRGHHNRLPPTESDPATSLMVSLQAANLAAAVLESPLTAYRKLPVLQDFLLNHIGMSSGETDELLAEACSRISDYAALFSFDVGPDMATEEILDQAKQLLQEIALSAQLQPLCELPAASANDAIHRDPLTNLYNRRFLEQNLHRQLAECICKKRPMACLFLDIDRFKEINDTYGHATGDEAIRHVARALEDRVREKDVVVRLGGDEFLVIQQNVDPKKFEAIANRIVADIPPYESSLGPIPIHVSVGAVYYTPQSSDEVDANWLIDQADRAMYRAKKGGGSALSVSHVQGKNAQVGQPCPAT